MKDIAIYGAGGLGKEVACLINRINEAHKEPAWRLIGFFDDGKPAGTEVSHYGKVLGSMSDLNSWNAELCIAIAVGSPLTVKKIAESIDNSNISFPNLIDRSFYVVDQLSFALGKGNIIQGPGSVSCDVTIGDFNLLNGGVVIGHDATIGSYNTIMPGVRISGQVKMGDCNQLGVNSIVLQQLNVGDGVNLGAGSVLMTKPKNNATYIGVPAKRLKF